jgi:hypothetical protein
LQALILDAAFPAIPFAGDAFVEPDAIEGEALPVQASTGGTVAARDMRDYGLAWSGGRQLHWSCASREGALSLLLPPTDAGLFDLSAAFTQSSDAGIAQLALDGEPLLAPIDLFHVALAHSGPIALGRRALPAGPHTLSVTINARNPKSAGYKFGLDWLKLTTALPER